MHSSIDHETLFKVIYIFRKTLPKHQVFFCVFVLAKFISPYLLTHNLKYLDTTSILFNKGFSRLTLLQENSSYYLSRSYAWASLSIFILIVVLMALTAFIAWLYSFIKRDKGKKIQGLSFNSHQRIKTLKKVLKCLSFVYLLIVFLSQHIVEYVFFAIFAQITQSIVSNNYAPNHIALLRVFIRNLPISLPIIVGLNCLTIIILFAFIYLFFMLASTKTISLRHGNITILPIQYLFVLVLLFQFQGVYSIMHYFNDDSRHVLRLAICIVITVLLGIYILLSIPHYNYGCYISLLFFDFMNLMCFISGVCEIIVYFLSDSLLPLKLSLCLKGIQFLNPFFIIFMIRRRLSCNALAAMSNRIFNEASPIQNINHLIVFLQFLSHYVEGRNVYDRLFECVYHHFIECNTESCYCGILIKKLKDMSYDEEKKEIIKLLKAIAERDIVQAIKMKGSTSILIDELLLFHVDYLNAVVNSHSLTLYVCQYYLMSKHYKLHFNYAYWIYEIYQITLHEMKKKKIEKLKYLVNNSEMKDINHLKENKENFKRSKMLQNLAILDNIKQTLINCCSSYERIMHFRQLMKTTKQQRFTCQDVIQDIFQLKHRQQGLHDVLNQYLGKEAIYPGEESYLLHSYFNLVLGRTPVQYMDRIKKMNSFTEIYSTEETDSCPMMILSLSIHNSLIVKYATLRFIEQLGYTQKEIIGNDIHDTLISTPFSPQHFAQMKLFLINGSQKVSKDTFVFSKSRNAYRVNLSIRPIPTKGSLSLIVKFKPSPIASTAQRTYYALTDQYLNVITTCSSFETRFRINTAILKEAKISLAQFFGVNYDADIAKVSKEFHKKRDWFDNFKPFHSIQTTVNEEDKALYYDDYLFLQQRKKVINKSLTRRRFIKSIECLRKNISQSGIDKEWVKNIEELAYEQSYEDEKHSAANETLFELTLELKNMGAFSYCILTIQEMVAYTSRLNLEKTQKEAPTQSLTTLNQLYGFNSTRITRSGLPVLLNNDQNQPDASLIFDEKNINDSNLRLFTTANHQSFNKDKRTTLLFSNKTVVKPDSSNDTSQKLRAFSIIKYVLCFLWLCLIALDLIYLFRNSNSYQKVETYFLLSITSYSLTSDIYYNSLAFLKICLIENQLSEDNSIGIQNKLQVRIGNMITHYYQLAYYINQMNSTAEIAESYSILTSYDTYYYMELNGSISQKNSTLTEEIYTLYFFTSFFTSITKEKCRIRELFYNDNYLSEGAMITTKEERALFYMLNNIIDKIAEKLFQINKSIDKIIKDFSDSNTSFVIIWVLSLCVIGLVFYNSIIVALFLLRNVLRSNLEAIFKAIPGEEVFVRNLVKYTELLNNVSFNAFYLYENKQLSGDCPPNSSLIVKTVRTSKGRDKDSDEKNGRSPGRRKIARNSNGKNKENKQAIDTEEQFKAAFRSFIKLPILIAGIVFSLSGIMSYIILQIVVIVFTFDLQNVTHAQINLSSNFLMRIPKLAEMLFYSMRSAFANDLYYLRTKLEEYDQFIIVNYYEVIPDMENNSYFLYLGDSYFAFLYYQILVTNENILLILKDPKRNAILPATVEMENQILDNDGFCFIPPFIYTSRTYSYPTLSEGIAKANTYTSECRPVYNGINLKGLQAAIDLLFNQFIAFYIDYFKLDRDKRDIDAFMGSVEYSSFEMDIQSSFRVLINVEYMLIEDDIKQSIASGGLLDIIFTFISLSINIIFGLMTILVFVSRLETYNVVISEFLQFFLTSIKCNCISSD